MVTTQSPRSRSHSMKWNLKARRQLERDEPRDINRFHAVSGAGTSQDTSEPAARAGRRSPAPTGNDRARPWKSTAGVDGAGRRAGGSLRRRFEGGHTPLAG